MTPFDAHLPPSDDLPILDDATLDLLVDGELSSADRRELLARLDSIPDGWRRCAMAFLEAQTWRQEFRTLSWKSQPGQATPSSMTRPERRRRLNLRALGTALAMAASFLLALGASFLLRNSWYPASPKDASEQVATNNGQMQPGSPSPSPRTVQGPARGAWQTVSVPVGDGTESLQLPAAERSTVDDAWVNNLPSAIPQEMLREWKRNGHQVDVERRLMPFPMKDGRQLVVPVDQVDVHFVGDKSYQ